MKGKSLLKSIVISASLIVAVNSAVANPVVVPLPANTSTDKQMLYNDQGTTAGAEVYYDKITESVGIGTDTPSVRLDVKGIVNATALAVNGVFLQSSSGTYWNYSSNDLYTFDDVVVSSGMVIGRDSYPGLDFYFNTMIFRDSAIKILFEDTSSSAAFPSNDWRFSLNDRDDGGDNYFAIDDVTAGTRPFLIEAGSPDSSIYVAATTGNVGIGTNTPQSRLQVNGYLQLALTSGVPPAEDCDAASEIGRMKVDSAAELLYFCSSNGWSVK